MGTEQTLVPTGRVPAVSGPCSTISAQNSCPNTQSADASRAGTPTESIRPVKCAKSASACRSEPQMPVDSERATTWPDDGTGSATSPTTSCPPLVTAARMPTHPRTARPPVIRRYVCPVSLTHQPGERPLTGRVALVTGAARPRGIGRATALGLARRGADVACLDIARPYDDAPFHGTGSGDDLASLATELTDLGVRAATAVADISDEGAVETAVSRVSEELGTVTLLANVAGGSGPGFGLGPLLGVAAPEFRRVLDVNVIGTWLVSKACATRMVAAGVGGRICNVSSQA